MNEHELKSALQDVMVASSPPPAMDPGAALDRARGAQRRRKAAWGGTVAGLAVVAIAVGAILVPTMTGGGGDSIQVAGQQSDPPALTETRIEPPPVTVTSPGGSESKTSTAWPDGQSDRTATSGPRADKGTKLLNDLASSLPAGVKAEDRTRVGFEMFGPMTRHQAHFNEYVGELQVWEYTATTPVVRTGEAGVGELFIQVETKGNTRLGDAVGCAAATKFEYPISGGTCALVDVGGKQVAVVTGAIADPGRNTLESAAFYRHPDGTLVIVGHSREYLQSGHPALLSPALDARQLAAIAADAKFHLD